MSQKTLIIIPAYNEAGNIKKTLQEISSLDFPVTILVIDDGSNDTTAEEALASGALVISLPFNLGIGGAVQTGFKYALEKGFDIAIQVDGDGQHDVQYTRRLMQPLIAGQADMAIGSRFLPPYLGYRSSAIRRIGINFFSCLLSFLTQNKVTDPTSGFRAYNRKAIASFAEYYPQDYPEPEAIAVAGRFRLRVLEVPVQMRERATGDSSIRYLMTLYYMVKVTCAILLNMIKTKRTVDENGH